MVLSAFNPKTMVFRFFFFSFFKRLFSPAETPPVFFIRKTAAGAKTPQVVLHGDGTLNEPLRLAPYEGAFFLAGL